jgi:hypothetical protein
MAKTAAAKKPLSKSQLMANIAAATDLPKKQVAAMLEALAAESVFSSAASRRGSGTASDASTPDTLPSALFPTQARPRGSIPAY